MIRSLMLLPVLALLVSSPALAAIPGASEVPSAPGTPEVEEKDLHFVAITFTPANLLLDTLKVNGEFRLAEKWGLQVSLGKGNYETGKRAVREIDIREAGGQVRWYALGDFDHGLHLGAELMFIDLSFLIHELDKTPLPEPIDSGISATAIGPFVGYKVAAGFGLTAELQLGLQYYGIEARAGVPLSTIHDSLDGLTAELAASTSLVLPLANLNLGWSF
jgi:hypothetical protein